MINDTQCWRVCSPLQSGPAITQPSWPGAGNSVSSPVLQCCSAACNMWHMAGSVACCSQGPGHDLLTNSAPSLEWIFHKITKVLSVLTVDFWSEVCEPFKVSRFQRPEPGSPGQHPSRSWDELCSRLWAARLATEQHNKHWQFYLGHFNQSIISLMYFISPVSRAWLRVSVWLLVLRSHISLRHSANISVSWLRVDPAHGPERARSQFCCSLLGSH